jgi:hypothetical protein
MLKIGDVEITGPAAEDFQCDDGCAGLILTPGRSCTIRLTYTGTADGRATLVIHQNLDGPASMVALSGRSTTAPSSSPPGPRPDLTLSAAHLRCSVVRSGALSGADGSIMFLSILDIGTVQVQHLVPFSLRSDTRLSGGELCDQRRYWSHGDAGRPPAERLRPGPSLRCHGPPQERDRRGERTKQPSPHRRPGHQADAADEVAARGEFA